MLIGKKITVLGAGIGGLAVAVALAQRGAQVQVIEQADMLSEVGAGIQISPNGAAVLRALGALDDLVARSQMSTGVDLRDYLQGRMVLGMNLPGTFVLAHRADLIEALADAAHRAGVRIRLGQKVADVVLHSDALPQVQLESGQTEDAPLLIGADGVRSRLRAIAVRDIDPQFTGQVAWRALVPVAAGSVPSRAQVFMGKGRHMVCYPLRDGRLLNMVGVEERSDWAMESWSQHGDVAAFQAAFDDFGGPVPGWISQVSLVNLWGLFRHPIAPQWSRNGAVLLGDAAHPTLPFLAQGANLALEDAFVLARMLAEHDTEHQAFAAYQAARVPRVTRAIAAANGNARNYHLRNSVVRFGAHSALRLASRFAPQAMPRKFNWLYGHDVTA